MLQNISINHCSSEL